MIHSQKWKQNKVKQQRPWCEQDTRSYICLSRHVWYIYIYFVRRVKCRWLNFDLRGCKCSIAMRKRDRDFDTDQFDRKTTKQKRFDWIIWPRKLLLWTQNKSLECRFHFRSVKWILNALQLLTLPLKYINYLQTLVPWNEKQKTNNKYKPSDRISKMLSYIQRQFHIILDSNESYKHWAMMFILEWLFTFHHTFSLLIDKDLKMYRALGITKNITYTTHWFVTVIHLLSSLSKSVYEFGVSKISWRSPSNE